MDIIGNNLTTIRNAFLAGHKSVILPNINKINSLLTKLQDKKILISTEKIDDKYTRYDFAPALKSLTIKRISKPGRRLYENKSNISDRRDFGFQIISTSKGVLTDKEAWKNQVGGEIICKVVA